jgi:hypothetical protein
VFADGTPFGDDRTMVMLRREAKAGRAPRARSRPRERDERDRIRRERPCAVRSPGGGLGQGLARRVGGAHSVEDDVLVLDVAAQPVTSGG